MLVGIRPRTVTVLCARKKTSQRDAPATKTTPNRAIPKQHVVGIDLGTTNSALAVIEQGRPVIVPVAPGDARTTPSVLHVRADGSKVIGQAAKSAGRHFPKDTLYSSKRFIGQQHTIVTKRKPRVAFDWAAAPDGTVHFPLTKGVITPEEVAAHILRHLLTGAEQKGYGQITKAVISVPAYFNEAQTEATEAAGLLAGLETVRLIREPIAAALAYGVDAQQDQTILVLDLGGGTFDVSLLEVGGGTIEVLATGGDPHLGGDDWDDAIVQWLGETHLRPLGLDWKRPSAVGALRTIAESAKRALSASNRVQLQIPVPAYKHPSAKQSPQKPGEGPALLPLEVILTRGQMEKLAAPLYRRMREAIDKTCWQVGVDLEQVIEQQSRRKQAPGKGLITPKGRLPVSEVLLVGGATRMEGLRQLVRNMTGLDAREFVVDPDEAVALGAAVQAGIFEGTVEDLHVMDVWQAALTRAFAAQHLTDQATADSGSDDEL
ncbi:hypothetical protein WJX73_006199 [Symbiochloris irregularis]|uniref:Molecular chaperone DnaK n=1 Tax=Symbiochloris irregularis TaxID=706552 RepID=A0AAW1PU78_9CHLO